MRRVIGLLRLCSGQAPERIDKSTSELVGQETGRRLKQLWRSQISATVSKLGGVLPCAEFGANAAWWRIQCLAWNLVRGLQLHVLPEELRNCHMKRLRFRLLCIAGKVVKTARSIILKLSRGHPSFNIYKEAREKIFALAVP
ncbi:MAG: transposase [Pseudomonadota bacterium]